jgi:hypothetical protein
MAFTESVVEDAALIWLGELGYLRRTKCDLRVRAARAGLLVLLRLFQGWRKFFGVLIPGLCPGLLNGGPSALFPNASRQSGSYCWLKVEGGKKACGDESPRRKAVTSHRTPDDRQRCLACISGSKTFAPFPSSRDSPFVFSTFFCGK